MRLAFVVLIFLIIFFGNNSPALAQNWQYPMTNYFERQTLKGFGQLIDDKFYEGKEILFPFNKFYGYHAAVDLEYLLGEKENNVPVYAITSGKIKYIGELDGYGGVILQDIGDDKTALYGHVKIKNMKHKTGEEIKTGTIITYLGDEFSKETSKERKHLHFGIYKGKDLYFKGHENSKVALIEKWENPTNYLREKQAVMPDQLSENSKTAKISLVEYKQKSTIWDIIISWLRKLQSR